MLCFNPYAFCWRLAFQRETLSLLLKPLSCHSEARTCINGAVEHHSYNPKHKTILFPISVF